MKRIIAAFGVTSAIVALMAFAPARRAVPAQLAIDIATLHAAALSTARTPRDSADAPYLLVTILGPHAAHRTMQLPATAHWTIHQDEAKGATPLTSLTLAPGDSVRVLLTLLEADLVDHAQESLVAAALTKVKPVGTLDAGTIAPALAPLTRTGTHWLGSATMLLTNEGGTTYWRALACVSTCSVSKAPGTAKDGSSLTVKAAQPVAGVVELSGNGATYHLQLTAKRDS